MTIDVLCHTVQKRVEKDLVHIQYMDKLVIRNIFLL